MSYLVGLILFAMAGQMATRLRKTSRKVSDLAFMDVTGRVARTLLEMADEVDGVKVITLRRPEALNALHDELTDEILAAGEVHAIMGPNGSGKSTFARALGGNEDLVETICLAHDLGHSPFGHSGEVVLARLMKDFGGFDHNKQSLRIVTELEQRYPEFPGLNLPL